ncbi:MAG: hypothetical protein HY960_12645 [Ignavibacteriae bacterium]|nr:hypothetical protein [Ignavibacteriota bacterium]
MEFLQSLKKWKHFILPTLLGATGGYAYYYFIGCVSGTCAITSNPYISTGYGALMGFLVFSSFRRKPVIPNGSQEEQTKNM